MASPKLIDLTEKRKALNARIKREQMRVKGTERRNDTRRKVLAGAVVLEWAGRDSEFSAKLMQEMQRFLVRDADRALFNLTPVQNAKS